MLKTLIFKFKKNIKNMFCTFIKKTLKNMHKNIKLQYPFKLEAPSIRIK